MTTLLVIGLCVLFLMGAPLFSIMLAGTALGAMLLVDNTHTFFGNFSGPLLTTYGMGTKDESIVFTTIPLFIYCGYIMAASKTADRLVRFSNALMGWMPGGLAIVTIFACAVFTVFTGASGVTIIALGGVVMPALIKQRYPEKFALGLVAGTGSVGLLFPPALPLFIYGTVYGLNRELKDKWSFDTERFLGAGIGPGLTLILCLSIVAVIVAVKNKVPRQRFDLGELAKSFVVAIPELILPLLVIGLLVTGVASIPEAAGLTVLYLVLIEGLLYRDINPGVLWRISTESMALVGTIFLVIYTSSAFTNMLVTAEVPQDLVKWTTAHVSSKWVFLLALNLILLLVGTMMDIFSALIVVVPLVAGIADYYGVNPYHLGVIFLLNLELGYIHPPVGINLFITSFKFQKPLMEVVKAVLPFLGAMFVALMLVTYIPQLTWVPPPKRNVAVSALVSVAQDGYLRSVAVDEIKCPGKEERFAKKSVCLESSSQTDQLNCYQPFIDYSACGADEECLKQTTQAACGGEVGPPAGTEVAMPDGHVIKVVKLEGKEQKICQICKAGTCTPMVDDEGDYTNSEGCLQSVGEWLDCNQKDAKVVPECQAAAIEDFIDTYGEDVGISAEGGGDDEESDGGVEEPDDEESDGGVEASDAGDAAGS